MYAIIQTAGRQVKVTPGGFATLDGTAGEPGAKLTLENVLLVENDGGDVFAGAPFVASARVRWPSSKATRAGRRSGFSRRSGGRACGGPTGTAPFTRACASRIFS